MTESFTNSTNEIIPGKADRYPGMRPFSASEKNFFFGRNKEVDELVHSISVHRSLVLYGKSGLGKSSLVNAGIIPALELLGFYSINIRFKIAESNPIDIVINEINNKISAAKNPSFSKLKNISDVNVFIDALNENGLTLLLIFDQFEEFFDYSFELRIKFLNSFINEVFSNKNRQKKSQSKILFSIRADRLSMMEELAPYMPTILSNRYQLQHLTKLQAEQAIVLPAQLPQVNIFKTKPFVYTDEALQLITNKITDVNNEVESTQLQIVCQEMERIAGKKMMHELIKIEPNDFNGDEGLENIINEFYQNQLQLLQQNLKLSKNDLLIIRELIEDDLLSDGKRISQSEGKLKERLKTIKSANKNNQPQENLILDKLLDLRLLREENTHLGNVYEISHDTLVKSISKARNERIAQENQKIAVKKTRKMALIFLCILALFISGISFYNLNKTLKQDAQKKQEFILRMNQAKAGDNKLLALFYLTKALQYGKDSLLLERNKDLEPAFSLHDIYYIKDGVDNGWLTQNGDTILYAKSGTNDTIMLLPGKQNNNLKYSGAVLFPQTDTTMLLKLYESWGIDTSINSSTFGYAQIMSDNQISAPEIPKNISSIENFITLGKENTLITWGLSTDSLFTCNIWGKTGDDFFQLGSSLSHNQVIRAADLRYKNNVQQLITWDDSSIRVWYKKISPDVERDISPELFKLQTEVITGTTYNEATNKITCLSAKKWKDKFEEWKKAGEEHYLKCTFKKQNIWASWFAKSSQ